jgi:hypothetical protein
MQCSYLVPLVGAIAAAVSRWLPTAAARVHARVWQVGFVVDRVALGQVFCEYFGFPAKTIHSTNFSILTITRGRYNRSGVAAVPSGPSMDSTPQYSNTKIVPFVLGLLTVGHEKDVTTSLRILLNSATYMTTVMYMTRP